LSGLPSMRLRHIEVFNAVMVTGSFSGAARLINITQPAVSRTLKHAELQLGFPLFERTGGDSWPRPRRAVFFRWWKSCFLISTKCVAWRRAGAGNACRFTKRVAGRNPASGPGRCSL